MARLRDERGHPVEFLEQDVKCLGDDPHAPRLVVNLEDATEVWRRD